MGCAVVETSASAVARLGGVGSEKAIVVPVAQYA
jgi:hypothetical protein